MSSDVCFFDLQTSSHCCWCGLLRVFSVFFFVRCVGAMADTAEGSYDPVLGPPPVTQADRKSGGGGKGVVVGVGERGWGRRVRKEKRRQESSTRKGGT